MTRGMSGYAGYDDGAFDVEAPKWVSKAAGFIPMRDKNNKFVPASIIGQAQHHETAKGYFVRIKADYAGCMRRAAEAGLEF